MLEQRGADVTGYLVIHEITCTGDLSSERLDGLMNALLDVESGDDAIAEPDLAASLKSGNVDVQMTVEAADPAEAATKALCAVRAAIHAMGDSTPGWETAHGIMRISTAEATDRLYAEA
jgi:hypothetical protein